VQNGSNSRNGLKGLGSQQQISNGRFRFGGMMDISSGHQFYWNVHYSDSLLLL
jgi:hypothetical protein